MEDPKQSMGGISTYFDYLYKVKSIFSMCNVVLDRLPVLTLEVTLLCSRLLNCSKLSAAQNSAQKLLA